MNCVEEIGSILMWFFFYNFNNVWGIKSNGVEFWKVNIGVVIIL